MATGIIFESLMEHSQSGWNASQGGDWNGTEAANINSITRSTEVAKEGLYSAKFNLNKTDTLVAGSYRAELTDWSGRLLTQNNVERWHGLSCYLPDSYIIDPCEEILTQWHLITVSNPCLALMTNNGNWVLMRYGHPHTNLGAYQTGVWTDWVFHIKWSTTSTNALLEVWKNGVLVLTQSTANQPVDASGEGPYHKVGIYKYGWKDGYPTTTTSRTVYYDQIRTGDETSDYNSVTPTVSMLTSTSPNIQVTVTESGTYTGRLIVSANGLSTEKAVEVIVKPDPTPPPPPVNPYPPDVSYTNLGALPALAKSNYLQEVTETVVYNDGLDPAVRTVTRVSDTVVFNTTTASLLVHHYSKTRAWNCDQSMMIVGRHILEGGIDSTHKVLINLVNTVGVNHQWSFTDPNLCYYVDNNRLYKFVVNAGKTAVTRTLLHNFTTSNGFKWVQLGPSEGQIARNDTTIALNVPDDGAGGKRVIVFDINTLTITANKTHAAMGLVSDGSWRTDRPNLNFATITPSANFVVCRIENATGSHLLFDNNLNFIRDLGGGSHMDFGFLEDGATEVATCLTPCCYQILADNPSATRVTLASVPTILANQGSSGAAGGHTSCPWQRNGWMYVSFTSFRKEILAFKLDTSGTVERFCFARDTALPAVETQGCPSPDGKMVVFKAKWNGDTQVLSYLVKRKN